VILHLGSRRVVHVNTTAHPTDAWVAQQLREATPFGEKAKYLICDSDTKYGPLFHAAAKTCGSDIIHTPFEAPRANAVCERFVGSLRRECLDYLLVLGDRQLGRVLKEYSEYFNQARPHQGRAQQTPEASRLSRASMTTAQRPAVSLSSLAPARGAGRKLIAMPVLNGLHHSYAWVT
jgi:transposase InsO family protein